MKKLFYFLLLGGVCLLAFAEASYQPLPLEKAFQVSAQLFAKDTVLVHWNIAPHHYLYRERFQFQLVGPTEASIGTLLFPTALLIAKDEATPYQIYRNKLTISVPLIHADPKNNQLQIKFQGCSDEGYCYPPITQTAYIDFRTGTVHITSLPFSASSSTTQEAPFVNILMQNHIITIFLAFFGFGALLSLTPCVLPMIPILSGIIVGKQKANASLKSFTLSLVYVLSMATTYAVFGVLAGYMGESIQALFQKPWILALYSGLFVLLALSFFGLYHIKLPAKFEAQIAKISQNQKRGHYVGVAVMGCLATLIISPCVTPALVGVLSYIGKTGNAFSGGITLFFMGLGMGLPLLLIGVAGGKLVPKAGPWMRNVESIFGVLFLAIAIWILSRIVPPQLTLLLWGLLSTLSSVYVGAFSPISIPMGKLKKGLGLVLFVYGIIMLVGVAQGNGDPLKPLSSPSSPQLLKHSPVNYFPIVAKNLEDVKNALVLAKSKNKPALLNFYADWCINCQEMEKTTFSDKRIQEILSRVVVVKVNITQNDLSTKKLLKHFNVVAPPTLLFFNSEGKPATNLTWVGKISVEELLKHIDDSFAI